MQIMQKLCLIILKKVQKINKSCRVRFGVNLGVYVGYIGYKSLIYVGGVGCVPLGTPLRPM